MNLREYCQLERGRRITLSEKALIAVQTIDKVMRGEPCSLRMALALHRCSGREVDIATMVKPKDLALLEFYREG